MKITYYRYKPSEPNVLVTKTSFVSFGHKDARDTYSDVYQQNWRLQDISKTFWKLNANVFDVFNL